jgi:hypothetical protein
MGIGIGTPSMWAYSGQQSTWPNIPFTIVDKPGSLLVTFGSWYASTSENLAATFNGVSMTRRTAVPGSTYGYALLTLPNPTVGTYYLNFSGNKSVYMVLGAVQLWNVLVSDPIRAVVDTTPNAVSGTVTSQLTDLIVSCESWINSYGSAALQTGTTLGSANSGAGQFGGAFGHQSGAAGSSTFTWPSMGNGYFVGGMSVKYDAALEAIAARVSWWH